MLWQVVSFSLVTIMSMPHLRLARLNLQARGFIVSVKAVPFKTRPAIANADVELHTELRLCLDFSAHDRADPRLAQTDNPVLDALGAVDVHFFLLRVDCLDCGKLLLKFSR